ncbi:MAG: hypothetical protein ICV64_03240 [Thermoleophilia bacterium]|nr:hypothetical protein [Thermoleophilia bacterium]
MERGDLSPRELQGQIECTVRARQALREAGAAEVALERNRRELVALQWRLAHALGRAHARRAA